MAGAVHEADVPHELEAARAGGAQARKVVVLGGAARREAGRARTFRIVAFVNFGVCVTF